MALQIIVCSCEELPTYQAFLETLQDEKTCDAVKAIMNVCSLFEGLSQSLCTDENHFIIEQYWLTYGPTIAALAALLGVDEKTVLKARETMRADLQARNLLANSEAANA